MKERNNGLYRLTTTIDQDMIQQLAKDQKIPLSTADHFTVYRSIAQHVSRDNFSSIVPPYNMWSLSFHA